MFDATICQGRYVVAIAFGLAASLAMGVATTPLSHADGPQSSATQGPAIAGATQFRVNLASNVCRVSPAFPAAAASGGASATVPAGALRDRTTPHPASGLMPEVTMLDYSASWCEACIDHAPDFARLARACPNAFSGFLVDSQFNDSLRALHNYRLPNPTAGAGVHPAPQVGTEASSSSASGARSTLNNICLNMSGANTPPIFAIPNDARSEDTFDGVTGGSASLPMIALYVNGTRVLVYPGHLSLAVGHIEAQVNGAIGRSPTSPNAWHCQTPHH